jgi:hypothetical protein
MERGNARPRSANEALVSTYCVPAHPNKKNILAGFYPTVAPGESESGEIDSKNGNLLKFGGRTGNN